MQSIQIDEAKINSKDKKFIEDLKEISIRNLKSFIVFDKKDITLKIDIDEVKIKMPKQEFYSKVNVEISYIKPENIIKNLEHIPNHLAIRLESDHFEQIIELMKNKTLIEKLKEQRIKFLHKDIEIEPRIIKNKIDEDDLKNEVIEIKTKRDRLNMDCDK